MIRTETLERRGAVGPRTHSRCRIVRHKRNRPGLTTLVLALSATIAPFADAQQVAVPLRQLPTSAMVVATMTFKSLYGIRVLSDGRVLVNDGNGRQLVLLDSALRRATPLLDTTGQAVRGYPTRAGSILPFIGDSSLFIDPDALSMLVLDASGKIARQIATPTLTGRMGLFGLDPSHGGGSDGHGHLVFQADAPRKRPHAEAAEVRSALDPDSVPIIRFDIRRRTFDTVAALMRVGPVTLDSARDATGRVRLTFARHPLTESDGCVVRADGTIGVVREVDYRVDWITPDGVRSMSPKISHDWVHVTDSAKVAIIDSARASDSELTAMFAARRDSAAKKRRDAGTEGAPTARLYACCGGVTYQVDEDTPTSIVWAAPGDLPDYRPPFSQILGAVKADADNNLWIRTLQPNPLPGGPVFDVVNPDGKLVDRVQIPGGTFIEGFGRGVIYLGSAEGTGYKLARVRIH